MASAKLVCPLFDSWASPADIRLGWKVYGEMLDGLCNMNPTIIIAGFGSKALAYDAIRKGRLVNLWIIDIDPGCSWHYHREGP
ncbi:MAG TPA: hypothetical protein VIV09_14635 [Pseudolabrys sp.]